MSLLDIATAAMCVFLLAGYCLLLRLPPGPKCFTQTVREETAKAKAERDALRRKTQKAELEAALTIKDPEARYHRLQSLDRFVNPEDY